jgi:hypothetical protein
MMINIHEMGLALPQAHGAAAGAGVVSSGLHVAHGGARPLSARSALVE